MLKVSNDGVLDPSFGIGGVVVRNSSDRRSQATDIVQDSSGRLVLSGVDIAEGVTSPAVFRYSNSGVPDASFGSAGVAYVVSNPGEYGVAFKVAVDSADRPVTIGIHSAGYAQTSVEAIRYGGTVSLNPEIGQPSVTPGQVIVGGTAQLTVNAQSDPLSPFVVINRVEYFLDSDPGPGLGTSMSLDSGTWTAMVGQGLSAGVYDIGVRARDSAGNWSAIAHEYLVVFDPAAAKGVTGKNKTDLVPTIGKPNPADDDVMPGLIAVGQNDAVDYGFTVEYKNGVVDPKSDFALRYETGTKCGKPQAVNCHSFNFSSTSIAWLSMDQVNFSRSKFQGVGVLLIDGVATTNPFSVEVIDGDLVSATAQDRVVFRVYAPGANPATATPIYRVAGNAARGNSVKVR